MKGGFMEAVIKAITEFCKVFMSDKILVILAVTAVTILTIIYIPDKAETIITSAFTGLFGVAVGMGIRRSGDTTEGGTK